ncbi:hypothetical protein [Erythrobacter sp.]|uniref:hypothetical protein n=1 Tax=Erythrobacter sp. TaxID=1042 RepID=UPI00311EF88D
MAYGGGALSNEVEFVAMLQAMRAGNTIQSRRCANSGGGHRKENYSLLTITTKEITD